MAQLLASATGATVKIQHCRPPTRFRAYCVHSGMNAKRPEQKSLDSLSANRLPTTAQSAIPHNMMAETGDWVDLYPFGNGGLADMLRAARDLTAERRKNAQLIKEAAVMKQKLSAAQSSLAQAEQAKAASADTILLLKQEVESAKHLSRLARGDEFLAVRKANQRLSDQVAKTAIELRKVTAELDALRDKLRNCQNHLSSSESDN